VVLSRILQMDFREFSKGEVRRILILGRSVNERCDEAGLQPTVRLRDKLGQE
jgi:hypothetical protein